MTDITEDDYQDGMCDVDFDNGPETTDELTPWVVLFADQLDPELQVTDDGALAAGADIWHELLDE